SLENHMLQKMRNAGDLALFVARARAHKEPKGHRARRRTYFADHVQAIGQLMMLKCQLYLHGGDKQTSTSRLGARERARRPPRSRSPSSAETPSTSRWSSPRVTSRVSWARSLVVPA